MYVSLFFFKATFYIMFESVIILSLCFLQNEENNNTVKEIKVTSLNVSFCLTSS